MNINGKAIRYGDNVDTDVIIPARYLNTSDPEELAGHCMEDLDPAFLEKVKTAQIIVAGKNFGCGSSREHAPLAIKHAGVRCVVAKSFARIFYRNAINIGLPIVVSDLEIGDGDELNIDLSSGKISNTTKGSVGAFPEFPEFLRRVIDAGGLLKAMGGGNL